MSRLHHHVRRRQRQAPRHQQLRHDRDLTGDIGIAGTGTLAQPVLDANGDVNFAAPNSGQAGISNTTINGTVNYNVAAVQTIMNDLNTPRRPGALAGTARTWRSTRTRTKRSWQCGALTGTAWFNVTSFNSGNGENLIIKGDGSERRFDIIRHSFTVTSCSRT